MNKKFHLKDLEQLEKQIKLIKDLKMFILLSIIET